MIRIVVTDDHELFREGLLYILNKETKFSILHQAESGDALLEYLANGEKPDILLLDLSMPGMNGVETTKVIRKKYPDIRIIALTSHYSDSFISNMLEYGACSFLNKDMPVSQLIEVIKEVYQKGFYYNEDILKIINKKIIYGQKKTLSKFDKNHLSKREVEILILTCHQLTTSEIAHKLFISQRTVEWHRNNLLIKTESKNMIGLLIYALENSIINIDELLASNKNLL